MTKVSFTKKGFHGPTPKTWEKMSNAMLYFAAGASAIISGLPLPDTTKIWTNAIISGIALIMKTITMFMFTEPVSETPTEQVS